MDFKTTYKKKLYNNKTVKTSFKMAEGGYFELPWLLFCQLLFLMVLRCSIELHSAQPDFGSFPTLVQLGTIGSII